MAGPSEPNTGATPPPEGSGGWGGGASTEPSTFQINTVQAEKGPAPGIEYAELPIRVGAYIVDAIILSFCYFVVASVLIAAIVISGAWIITWFIVAALYAIGSAAYFLWSWTNLRGSPGQRILGLETVSAGNGATLTMDQAIRRYLYLFGPVLLAQVLSIGGFELAILGWLVSLIVFAYSIWLLYTVSQSTKRQGFHDIQAGTVVVRRSAATS